MNTLQSALHVCASMSHGVWLCVCILLVVWVMAEGWEGTQGSCWPMCVDVPVTCQLWCFLMCTKDEQVTVR